jgi:hypothetical protein
MTAVIQPVVFGLPDTGVVHPGHSYASLNGGFRNIEFVQAVRRGGSHVPHLAGVPTPAEMIAWRTAPYNSLTQAQVAELLGCSVARVQGFEDGSISPGGDGDTTYLRVYGVMALLS